MVVLVVCGLVGGLVTFFFLPRVVIVSMRTPVRDSVIVCPNATASECTNSHYSNGAVLMNLTVPLNFDNCNFRTGNISSLDFESKKRIILFMVYEKVDLRSFLIFSSSRNEAARF